MPVNAMRDQQRSSTGAVIPVTGLGPLNTTSFLFDDNDDKPLSLNGQDELISPIAKAYMQMTGDDKFPTLRHDGTSGIVSAINILFSPSYSSFLQYSANSAALDLATSKSPDPESWAPYAKHRPSHQSMPHTDSNMYRPALSTFSSPPCERSAELAGKQAQRHSMGVAFSGLNDTSKYEQSSLSSVMSRPTSLQSSYSTNDLPTVKSSSTMGATSTPAKTHAEQHFHNHNASLGRIPPGAISNRQSRDMNSNFGSGETKRDEKQQPAISVLQASAAPFGPQLVSSTNAGALDSMASPSVMTYNNAPLYTYGMHNFNVTQMGAQMNINSQLQAYQIQNQGAYGQFATYGPYTRGQDGPNRVGSARRAQCGDESRFQNVSLEDLRGQIYNMCKDQHGCRYLQRKLEEHNPDHIQAIFIETCPHIIELMTGEL